MFKNYVKTAFRSLLKNKGFTTINILGLALGLATCLLIVFYVVDELSYDRYNDKYSRIFRVNTDLKYHGTITTFAIAGKPVGEGLVETYPEVEKSARITPALNIRFKKGNETLAENNTFYSDQSIFEIFTFPMIDGNFKTALAEPNSVVITESIAKKYFNRTNVVGQTLLLVTDSSMHKITGVIRDIPVQSHIKADFFLPLARSSSTGGWNNISPFSTYILLKPGTDYHQLESKFDDLMRRKAGTPDFDYKKFEQHGNYLKLSLIPLTDIHLKSNRVNELGANGNIQYIYIFTAIALFILLLACINFMNLSTARSANRAREVGVRKVLGSSRKYLIAQFLSESLIITFAAAIIAVLAAWPLLPLFNHFSGKDLVVTGESLKWLLPSLVIIVFVVGVLAGSYPAFFLSAFRPVDVLKGKISAGFKGGALRSFLVVLQFSISIFLIIGTMVIYNQLGYIQNKDLGFNRNQVLVVKNAHALNNPKILKDEIKRLPGVLNATLTSHLPVGDKWPNQFISRNSKSEILGAFWQVDEDYLNTMGMKLVQGRNFSAQFLTDSLSVILNETAAKTLGYGNDVLNRDFHQRDKKYHIIGIVKDFNFHSLRDNISPLALVMDNDGMASLSIKVNTNNLPALMNQIEQKWKNLAPNQHFEYSFMDEDFDALYCTEQRMGQLFMIFTSLAIIIACLGLFGLAAYAAEQRNREIGIRKVLGATVSSLVGMLSKDFIRLVLISIFIATPLAWWAMQRWLQGFAYRQDIQWWVIASAALGSVLIAFITISFQSIKAALANPVDSLRSE